MCRIYTESLQRSHSLLSVNFTTAQKTLDATALLIKKDMFQEARSLLAQSDASVFPERLAMMKGYLAAAQGRCEAANNYFEEALSLGQKCIPEKYRGGCQAERGE